MLVSLFAWLLLLAVVCVCVEGGVCVCVERCVLRGGVWRGGVVGCMCMSVLL